MIEIKVIKHKDKFIGVALDGEHTILQTDEYLTERRAQREIRDMFRQSLYHCNHKYKDDGEISIDNAYGGIDYVHTSTCTKCGLSDITVGNRSIYEEYDYDG